MPSIRLDQAQARLPELVHSLALGNQVVITENNLPVARLINAATPLQQRKLGSMRGTVTHMAPDFDLPLVAEATATGGIDDVKPCERLADASGAGSGAGAGVA